MKFLCFFESRVRIGKGSSSQGLRRSIVFFSEKLGRVASLNWKDDENITIFEHKCDNLHLVY